MAKFKIWDKVVLVNPGTQHIDEGLVKGDILTIEEDDEIPYCSCVGKYNHIKDRSTRAIMQHRLELYEEPTKRIPKVGDKIRILKGGYRRYNAGDIITLDFANDMFMHNGDASKRYIEISKTDTREFRDGEVPERFREELLCEYIGELSGHQIYCDIPVPMFKAGDCDIGRTQDGSISICSTISDKPLSTIKKIMSKLEQFRANLYFSDKKMEKIGELADKLEGYASDIDDLVYNLEIVSGKLESYAEDIETAVDEDDRVAATQLIDEATEYLSKVSTLAPLASMLSNAKALDKFTDGK